MSVFQQKLLTVVVFKFSQHPFEILTDLGCTIYAICPAELQNNKENPDEYKGEKNSPPDDQGRNNSPQQRKGKNSVHQVSLFSIGTNCDMQDSFSVDSFFALDK